MPLITHLMLKYSDLIADPVLGHGKRSPRNFREQLLRCAGEIPINVFATVNNRFVLGELDAAKKGHLEAEFLNASTLNKVGRIRSRKRRDEPDSVVFTRVGALLCLKSLLGLSRPRTRFVPTAVGAIALHANDYAESADTSALASGLLSAVTEFAPVADLQNPALAGPVLRRFYFIYNKLMKADPVMGKLVRDELGCDLSDLTFSGLPFDSYFALLFGIYAVVGDGIRKRVRTSVLDLDDVATKAGIARGDLDAFIDERVLTLETAVLEVGKLDDDEAFVRAVTDSRWASDFTLFRERPLLRLEDGRHLVLDLQFLIESASRGLYWSIFNRLSATGRSVFSGEWGHLFESFVRRLLGHYLPDARFNVKYSTGEVDVLLVQDDAVLIIEVKSGMIPQSDKGSRDQVTLAAAIEKKYVNSKMSSGRVKPKGLTQLANAAAAIRRGEISDVDANARIYPILIGEDVVLAVFAMNRYLNQVFSHTVLPAAGGVDGVMPLTVMVIDEVETILPSVAADDVSLRELLDARFTGDDGTGVEPVPVVSKFYDIARTRRLRKRPETFLSEAGEELTSILDERFAALREAHE